MSQRKKINKNKELFIGAYKISPTLCDEIIEEFENFSIKSDCTNEYQGYICQVGDGFENNPGLKTKYLTALSDCLTKYKKSYKTCTWTEEWQFNGSMNIQKYPPGRHYSVPHSEIDYTFPLIKRHLVFMTYLNSIKEGGGTKFFNQKLVVKPKKGLTLIWPAHWTHTHIGIPAPKETKYVSTGWYEFSDDYKFFKSAEEFLSHDYCNYENLRINVFKK